MPTYEFRLPDGTIIERAFKISEVPAEIPNPNGEGVAIRIISGGAALLFKGSGFYLTDYGRNAHRTQGDTSKPAPDAKSSSDAPKPKTESGTSAPATDAKAAPAPKADAKPTGKGSAES
jgi:predicted nucleic acid-binding Zn ribbon protein